MVLTVFVLLQVVSAVDHPGVYQTGRLEATRRGGLSFAFRLPLLLGLGCHTGRLFDSAALVNQQQPAAPGARPARAPGSPRLKLGAVQTAVLYGRADKRFVPLKSPGDFDRRFEWDKAHFALIKKWLGRYLPRIKDLGTVEVMESAPTKVKLDKTRILTREHSSSTEDEAREARAHAIKYLDLLRQIESLTGEKAEAERRHNERLTHLTVFPTGAYTVQTSDSTVITRYYPEN